MDKNQTKNTLIKKLIAEQKTKDNSEKVSPEAFQRILAYLEQLDEKCNTDASAAEQRNIAQRVNTIFEENNICLSDDTLTALRQMLPVYQSILNQ